jgi:hypothetical protein
MLDAAAAAGYPATRRLITDWVSIGLLAHPTRRSTGPRGGRGQRLARWPDSQRGLFLGLLHQRRELARQQGVDERRVRRIATLCNIPVGLWLYYHPSIVTTAQARSATETWCGAHRRGSWASARAARQSARDVLDSISATITPAEHQALVKTLGRLLEGLATTRTTDAQLQGGIKDALLNVRPALLNAAVTAAEPATVESQGGVAPLDAEVLQFIGQVDAQQRVEEQLVRYARALYARVIALRDITTLTDTAYTIARDELAGLGARTPTRTPDSLVSHACSDLLTILGYDLIAANPDTP